jgi:hypothetical protein
MSNNKMVKVSAIAAAMLMSSLAHAAPSDGQRSWVENWTSYVQTFTGKDWQLFWVWG